MVPSSASLAQRVLRFLPLIVAGSPERVVLNLGCMLIGSSALVAIVSGGDGGRLLDKWPDWFSPIWALAMIVGGGAVLAGMHKQMMTLERLGYILVGLSCLIFAVSAFFFYGLQ